MNPLCRAAAFLLLLLPSLPAAARPAAGGGTSAGLSPGAHDMVVNGVRLWYRVAGRPGGTPVLFLHGGPGEGSQSFAKFAGPALERRLRMVYLDQRGSGRSERPWNKAYSLDLLVDDVDKLRRAWGVTRIDLIAHSFGTVIALEYAARHPQNVAGLVLAASVPDLPAALDIQCDRLKAADPEAFARAVTALRGDTKRRCNVFAAYSGEKAQAFTYANMFPSPETARLVDAADAEGGLKNNGELGRALFAAGLLDYRFQHPERIAAPVLFVTGARDFQAVVEPQQALAARLPHARLLQYPDAGHFMFVDAPERFGNDVGAFLSGLR
jgi:proline iminopeptidase